MAISIFQDKDKDLNVKPEIKEEDFIDKTDPNQPEETTVKNDGGDDKISDKLRNTIVIDWSTKFPIDKVYAYINHDWAAEGFNNAIENSDRSNMESKMKSIELQFLTSIEMVKIEYEAKIKKLEVKIQDLLDWGHVNDSKEIKAQVEIYNDHLKKLEDMKAEMKNPESHIKSMLENYQRGFTNGVSSKVMSNL